MRVFAYGKERKEKSNSDIYFKALVIGSVTAVLFIVFGISLKFIILKVIDHWIISLVIIIGCLLAKKLLFRKKRRGVVNEYTN